MAAAQEITHLEAVQTQVEKHTGSVFDLEREIKELPEEEKLDVDSMTQHFFGPGVYLRQMFIPQGCVATGYMHKKKNLTILASGVCAFTDGENPEIMIAPKVFCNEMGDKRALYALEDTVIMTVHKTDETDVDKIEKEFVTNDPQEMALCLLEQGEG